MTESEPTNADRARRGFELWNERRIDEMLTLFHEDAVWDMTPFGVPDRAVSTGHPAIRRFFDEWMTTFPDSTIEIEEVEQRGDWTLTVVLQTVERSFEWDAGAISLRRHRSLARRSPRAGREPSGPRPRPGRFRPVRFRAVRGRDVLGFAVATAVALAIPATASAQGATFTARGSAEQVWVTGASPGEKLTLVDGHGHKVERKTAGPLGGIVFRKVDPGDRYRVRKGNGGPHSALIRVLTDKGKPPSTDIYNQQIGPATAT